MLSTFRWFSSHFLRVPPCSHTHKGTVLNSPKWHHTSHPLSPSQLFFVFCLYRATPEAYGGYQAKGQIGALAPSLYHRDSNIRSKPRLWPTLQLTATPDPRPTERGQGLNPQPHGSKSDSFRLCHDGNSLLLSSWLLDNSWQITIDF